MECLKGNTMYFPKCFSQPNFTRENIGGTRYYCILLKIIEGPILSIITLMHFELNVF